MRYKIVAQQGSQVVASSAYRAHILVIIAQKTIRQEGTAQWFQKSRRKTRKVSLCCKMPKRKNVKKASCQAKNVPISPLLLCSNASPCCLAKIAFFNRKKQPLQPLVLLLVFFAPPLQPPIGLLVESFSFKLNFENLH